jgi:hypothetical protein
MSSLRQSLRGLIRRIGDDPYRHRVNPLSKACQERALQLLKQHLSPAQREQFEKLSYFYVTGGYTKNTYRIRHGVQMNVEQLDKSGIPILRLCFLPRGCLAVGDVMLAQKIALELYEKEALKIAIKALPFDISVIN